MKQLLQGLEDGALVTDDQMYDLAVEIGSSIRRIREFEDECPYLVRKAGEWFSWFFLRSQKK